MQYGATNWSHCKVTIARSLPGRIGKQCQERWHNHLNPDIQRDAWTTEEHALNNAHRIYGNKWVEIAKFLPRRSSYGTVHQTHMVLITSQVILIFFCKYDCWCCWLSIGL
ncbi:transcription factor MYB3R-2 [Triticum aestivum]|uniref:transcription factor MYB3R-2 n=1 Tax=Triticum aestivum TaxID=4565 RepID=UPI001D0200C5|nr:transcription factor MYB3R-2-like [Triticum aestivum]